ncbi:hydroxyisourate hydrolase [Marinobacterium litorale]|uniref:hydroxyisourate hydrolase n=1 Tax=Marinobacterium litorale TaxID=404770 RepID=UPI000404E4B2|nr:hydroxyisourate hydrolase [Marinobacterium litorale]
MSQITTHILDTAQGSPAEGVQLELAMLIDGTWQTLAKGTTNTDGRVADLLPSDQVLPAGRYRMRFELELYLLREGAPVFYPRADIEFMVADGGEHYHIPLLLSPFGYSTYRGS